ncbi:hypothetical protein L6Q96_22245 [Candidatus Binatia bacterium]|nr:hypothetical protein [Candidatus Binatia bacterium]
MAVITAAEDCSNGRKDLVNRDLTVRVSVADQTGGCVGASQRDAHQREDVIDGHSAIGVAVGARDRGTAGTCYSHLRQ